MPTIHQIEANRRNAQRSTGPTSVTGKAASSLNALKTGLHAKTSVLPCENPADFQELIEDCYHQYQPSTPTARFLVDDLIRCEWALRRLDHSETQMYQYQNNDKYNDPEKFPLGKSATANSTSLSRLQYRFDAARRARDRVFLALATLQDQAEAAPPPPPVVEMPDPPPLTTSPQIGFVPSNPSTAQPQPAPRDPNPGPEPFAKATLPCQARTATTATKENSRGLSRAW